MDKTMTNCFVEFKDYKKFLADVKALATEGKSEKEIAEYFSMTIPQLRKMNSIVHGIDYKMKKGYITRMLICEPKFTIKEISEIMNIPEAIIRNIVDFE